ncbi:hypothetical protein [Rugosimonospora acidiphila]
MIGDLLAIAPSLGVFAADTHKGPSGICCLLTIENLTFSLLTVGARVSAVISVVGGSASSSSASGKLVGVAFMLRAFAGLALVAVGLAFLISREPGDGPLFAFVGVGQVVCGALIAIDEAVRWSRSRKRQ